MRISIIFTAFEPVSDLERENNLAVEGDLGIVEEVERSLHELGHSTERFPLTDDVNELLFHFQMSKPDLVFNLIDDFRGQIILQMNIIALFDLLGLSYTGSGPLAFGLSMDKALTKSILGARGIPIPRFQVAYKTKFHLDADFSFPVIVKPLYEGGSYGISNESVIRNLSAVEARVSYIQDTYHQPSIVEDYIDGREIIVSILGNDPPIVLPLCEMGFLNYPGSLYKIRNFQSKWIIDTFEYLNTALICPAALPSEVENIIKEIALKSHLAVGCRDYSKVDIRLDKYNRPYVIDVNTNPLISSNSSFIFSLEQSGRNYLDFIASLIDIAKERKKVA
jgi:D-alanine-D-alanine ligase